MCTPYSLILWVDVSYCYAQRESFAMHPDVIRKWKSTGCLWRLHYEDLIFTDYSHIKSHPLSFSFVIFIKNVGIFYVCIQPYTALTVKKKCELL